MISLALVMHELDEAVLARQRTEWIEDLLAMHHAMHAPAPKQGIALPPHIQRMVDMARK